MALRLPHGFASLQEIDDAYDPLKRAIDASASNRQFSERSEAARRALPYLPAISYGPTVAETLDIFPAAESGAPVFLFIHGGYWRARSARDFSCVAAGPHSLGFTTVVIDYALCPAVSLDEIVRQARAAAAWVLRHIGGHGGDPQRVVIGGHSAGGHLGAMLLATDWVGDYGLPADPFAGAVLVSGLYDIAPLRYSYLQPAIQLDEGAVQRNSPISHVRSCATPLVLSWGEAEQEAFARQSLEFRAAWEEAGNAAELAPQPGADHFSAVQAFEDPGSTLCQTLLQMGKPPTP
ncbi:alpha/beta hydrolase [Acidovorax sp. NCPPB 4044]|uniref:alpha/beta hydrolase n=1 Tax=Acidovorax sp. NCPPB 4044 TaxID=2940490 RepID=UPI0023044B58|nr:alpha/beta hydrolase [Acidovorax sp. NCPPB 4044]MDA8520673.1 alpha/beta hydrolase [Acidovorax sp. NCPPB 4044]